MLVMMQYRSGAYRADLACNSDEPAHAVSSLMVRDYLVQAPGSNPIAFARGFYAHYPKVAIGHWPPLFYCAEGAWMLLAGRNRVALLLLIALFGAALAASVFVEVSKRSGTVAALAAIAVLINSIRSQPTLWVVHPDMALALGIFWATIWCGRFMHTGERRSRSIFLVLFVVALLTHGRAAVLLLLPFALLPLRDRVRPRKWWPAGLALTILLFLPHLLGQSSDITLSTVLSWSAEYMGCLVFDAGWVALALVAVGTLRAFRKEADRSFWLAMAALPVCEFLFFCLEPTPFSERLLLPTLAAFAVLSGGGVQLLLERVERFGRLQRRALEMAFGVCAVASLGFSIIHTAPKPNLGYRLAVEQCLFCNHPVALVAGKAIQEGDLIAEEALQDPQRQHTVLRASKSLAHSTWSGKFYRQLFPSPEALEQFLDHSEVSLVVVEHSGTRPDVQQLRSAMMQQASEWVPQPAVLPGMDIFARAVAKPSPKTAP